MFRTPKYLPSAASSAHIPIKSKVLRKFDSTSSSSSRSSKFPIVQVAVFVFFIILIVIFVLYSLASRKKHKNNKLHAYNRERMHINRINNTKNLIDKKWTIFVSIHSFCNKDTPRTIYSLIQNADVPERVHIGICQENTDHDTDVVIAYNEICRINGISLTYNDKIQVLKWGALKSRGSCSAMASVVNQLYNNENFMMQVASHSRFEQGWDTVLISEWLSARKQYGGNDKIVLTGTPHTVPRYTDIIEDTLPTFTTVFTINKHAELPEFRHGTCIKQPSKYFMQLGFSSQFMFSSGARARAVPYPDVVMYNSKGYIYIDGLNGTFDADSQHDIDGYNNHESYVVGVLLWTHGWIPVMATHVPVRLAPHQITNNPERGSRDERKESLKTIYSILNGTSKRYPLGSVRSHDSFQDFLGVSLLGGTVEAMSTAGITPDASTHEIITKYGSVTSLKSFITS